MEYRAEGYIEEDMDDLVGVREAVVILGVSVDWLAGKRYRELPPAWRKIGSAFVYKKSDLLAFKEERERNKMSRQNGKSFVSVAEATITEGK